MNGKRCDLLYYLADGIYHSCAIFMKSIPQSFESSNFKEKMYSAAQEGVQKDIERTFGVLTMRFHILSLPCRLHDRVDMAYVMQACIIMHNMNVEARKDTFESVIGGLQQFENANRMFKRGSEFNWQSQEVTRDLMSSAFNDSIWVAMTSSRDERITSTVDHFS